MKNRELKRLLDTAKDHPMPGLPADFPGRVVARLRREAKSPGDSIFDELNRMFPRVAWAALLVIALCLAADFGHSLMAGPDLADGATQWLEQWLTIGI